MWMRNKADEEEKGAALLQSGSPPQEWQSKIVGLPDVAQFSAGLGTSHSPFFLPCSGEESGFEMLCLEYCLDGPSRVKEIFRSAFHLGSAYHLHL